MNYTDEVAIEDYTLMTIDPSFSARIAIWIEAMSRMIDKMANRTIASGTETTRKYDGNGKSELLIDECCDITAVTVDGTDVTSTVLQYPANQPNKYKLSFSEDVFTNDRQNVEVTGIFAMKSVADEGVPDEVPADIKFACTVFVAGLVNNSNNQSDNVKSESIGQYSVTYNDPAQRKDFIMAKEIVAGYRRIAV